ncbi:histidine phosphatase family protein [Pontibacter sp. SGAir0037]|uniref:SixA phosphatase family protein n=1 Tax=Pontibacter sp. SGAir0037 TaxID=2571030 RepID=UPI0010CCF8A4|nr:histidine phosphatase family protein [Pontibacter sp. SGAir0037]QCR21753.1 phosphohistidine phosphatase [Pontibacter sp. SGAir0037]
MQRNVLICRHAEASDPFPLRPDFERELTKDGIHQAHLAGQWLRDHFRKVDAILASPSNRTRTTAGIIAGRLYFEDENITYDPDLYNPRESQLIGALSRLPESVTNVLVVSHNPGVTQLGRTLTDKRIGYLEPAQVLAVSIKLEKWEEVHFTTGTLMSSNM